MMQKVHDIEGSVGGSCHVCGRDLENHTPREGALYETESGRRYTDVMKGIGICPEHGVSYDEVSVKAPRRGGCHCEKEDCPRCGGEFDCQESETAQD